MIINTLIALLVASFFMTSPLIATTILVSPFLYQSWQIFKLRKEIKKLKRDRELGF
jgi:hypothetical protein